MLKPPETPEEMRQMYKNVFGSIEGRIVLGDILTLGHFGFPLNAEQPELLGEYSLAITIARMAGAFDTIYSGLAMIEKEQ